jgi:hypothetical protein
MTLEVNAGYMKTLDNTVSPNGEGFAGGRSVNVFLSFSVLESGGLSA